MHVASKSFRSRIHGEFAKGDSLDHLPADVIAAFKKQRLVAEVAGPLAPKSASSRPARVSRRKIASESTGGDEAAGSSSSSIDPSSYVPGPTSSTPPTSDGGDDTNTSGADSPAGE